jgi:uncharacterized protein (TIGR04255 family)
VGEILKNPPLVEAICSFSVVPNAARDDLAERIYARLQPEFHDRAFVEDDELNASERRFDKRTRWEFRHKDEATVQLSSDLLAINHLRPGYVSWEIFRALIRRVLEIYVSEVGGGTASRIALRYINALIPPPEDSPRTTKLRTVLSVHPHMTGPLVRPLVDFYQRYELLYLEHNGVLVHQVGNGMLAEPEARPAIFLDLDFGSRRVFDLEKTTEIVAWLDAAHEHIGEAFRSSLAPSFFERLRRGDDT